MDFLVFVSFVVGILYTIPTPVSASGFVSLPPSRQARCNNDIIRGCGDVRWEPQNVVAPTGSLMCNGNGTRFPDLNDPLIWADRYFTVPAGADGLLFTWSIMTSRKTTSFQYFFMPTATGAEPPSDLTPESEDNPAWAPLTPPYVLLASFGENNSTVPSIVTHQVPFRRRMGRKTVLALWNIADVNETFYSCVDLVITGGDIPISIDDSEGYYYSGDT